MDVLRAIKAARTQRPGLVQGVVRGGGEGEERGGGVDEERNGVVGFIQLVMPPQPM